MLKDTLFLRATSLILGMASQQLKAGLTQHNQSDLLLYLFPGQQPWLPHIPLSSLSYQELPLPNSSSFGPPRALSLRGCPSPSICPPARVFSSRSHLPRWEPGALPFRVSLPRSRPDKTPTTATAPPAPFPALRPFCLLCLSLRQRRQYARGGRSTREPAKDAVAKETGSG